MDIIMNDILRNTNNLEHAGKVLYDNIKNAIARKEHVSIDINGVSSLPSILLNVSHGRIIDEKGKETLKNYVVFRQITRQQALRLKDYMMSFTGEKSKSSFRNC